MTAKTVQQRLDEAEKVVQEASEIIGEQNRILQEIQSPAGQIVMVLRLMPAPNALVVGSKVRLRESSEYAHQNSGTGVITKMLPDGWCSVRWDDTGLLDEYRCDRFHGDKIDLILADESTEFRDGVLVSHQGGSIEWIGHENKSYPLKPGQFAIRKQTSGGVVLSPAPLEIKIRGMAANVKRILTPTEATVEMGVMSERVVYHEEGLELEVGTEVLLDSSNNFILEITRKNTELLAEKIEPVHWDDIGGLEHAKMQIREAIEIPHSHPEIYKFYGMKPAKGVLLHGPPGCGKTMLGKAIATALAKIHGAAELTGFNYVKGPEILSMWVGGAEGNIRKIFSDARAHYEKHKYPAVIFIDEADAILGKRGGGGGLNSAGVNGGMEKTIVPMFLTEMDGFSASGAMVVLATNRPDTLDPAVVRDGRIDRKIYIPRPDKQSAYSILMSRFNKVPIFHGVTAEKLTELTIKELFHPERSFYQVHLDNGDIDYLCLHHLINGAMISSVVDLSISSAIQRDLKKGEQGSGITKGDVLGAIVNIHKQNLHVDHTNELREFLEPFQDRVKNVTKMKVAC